MASESRTSTDGWKSHRDRVGEDKCCLEVIDVTLQPVFSEAVCAFPKRDALRRMLCD